MLSYTLDAANRIVEIDGPWDEFATRNGAAHLTRASVRGRSLFAYVTGPPMQELLRLLLARIRGGETLALEFRCDAPAERRYLLFEGFLRPGDAVECVTTVQRTEARPPQALIDPAAIRSSRLVAICSWCRRVRLEDVWVEVEVAIARLGLLQEEPVPQLTHGICPDCAERLDGGPQPAV